MNKSIGLAGILALSALACQRKEEVAKDEQSEPVPAESTSSATLAGEEKKVAPETKPTKASERPPVTEKKIPVAEPLPDKPGFVKSPFNGQIIDVQGLPAGATVADPMYPAAEKKHFRVPKMSPENEAKAREDKIRRKLADETARQNALVAEPVPDMPGFVSSPYVKAGPDAGPHEEYFIDVSGVEPGSLIMDPTSTPDEPRYLKLHGGDAPAEGE